MKTMTHLKFINMPVYTLKIPRTKYMEQILKQFCVLLQYLLLDILLHRILLNIRWSQVKKTSIINRVAR